jgi:hypothetical protein
MNEYLSFWRVWSKSKQILVFTFLAFFLLMLVLVIWVKTKGLGSIISWDIYSELREKLYEQSQSLYSNLQFSDTGTVWYVVERYIPALVKLPHYHSFIFIFCFTLGCVFLFTGFSKLKNTLFFVSIVLTAWLVLGLRLENIFNSTSNLSFLLIFGVLGSVLYFINNFKPWLLPERIFLIWLGLISTIGLIIFYFSKSPDSLQGMASFGILAALPILAITIFLTAHETLAALYWLVSNSAKKGQNIWPQMALVNIIFLLNMVLIYLENTKVLSPSAFISHPSVIFILNLVLGIWGFRKYLHQTEAFSFEQLGFWLYSGLSMVSLGAVYYIYATANGPLMLLFEDLVAISVMVMSLGFVVYVAINYFDIIKQGLSFHLVIYKAPFSKFWYTRLVVFFGIIFVFSWKSLYPIYQFKSGLNLSIADYYYSINQNKEAEAYYNLGLNYDSADEKSNLSLASLALKAGDRVAAAAFYNQSLKSSPTPFAYAGLSYCLENEDLFFDALFKLKEGVGAFPKQSELYTNLAYVYQKAKQTDSSYLALVSAQKYCASCELEKSNELAFWIEKATAQKRSELAAVPETKAGISYQSNFAALKKMQNQGQTFTFPELKKDSALNVSQVAYLTNVLSNKQAKNISKGAIGTLISLKEKSQNQSYLMALKYAESLAQIYHGDKVTGLKELSYLSQENTPLKKVLSQNLGNIYIKEGLVDKAKQAFSAVDSSINLNAMLSPELKSKINLDQINQAADLNKGLSLKNYSERIKQAPFNPYLLSDVSAFLLGQNKAKEAYELTYYASDFIDHFLVNRATFRAALALGQLDFAEESLKHIALQSEPKELALLKAELQKKREDLSKF